MAAVVADERQFDHGLDVIFEGIRVGLADGIAPRRKLGQGRQDLWHER